MAIVKWEPFDDFDRWFFNDMVPQVRSKVGWDLAADMYEQDSAIVVEMHVPGIQADKVHIAVKDGYLHIAGSREEEKETNGKHYFAKEIKRGGFERVIRVPGDVDKKHVKAEYKGGILKITMPKSSAEEGTVRVEVKE